MGILEVCKWQWVETKTQYDLQNKFKEIKNSLHGRLTQIQSEYMNPIIPNGMNTKDLMRQIVEFAMNGVFAAFEMTSNCFLNLHFNG